MKVAIKTIDEKIFKGDLYEIDWDASSGLIRYEDDKYTVEVLLEYRCSYSDGDWDSYTPPSSDFELLSAEIELFQIYDEEGELVGDFTNRIEIVL